MDPRANWLLKWRRTGGWIGQRSVPGLIKCTQRQATCQGIVGHHKTHSLSVCFLFCLIYFIFFLFGFCFDFQFLILLLLQDFVGIGVFLFWKRKHEVHWVMSCVGRIWKELEERKIWPKYIIWNIFNKKGNDM